MEGADYTPDTSTLTLTPVMSLMCAEFNITVDGVREGREEFTVLISNTDPSARVSTNNSTAEIVIEGDYYVESVSSHLL